MHTTRRARPSGGAGGSNAHANMRPSRHTLLAAFVLASVHAGTAAAQAPAAAPRAAASPPPAAATPASRPASQPDTDSVRITGEVRVRAEGERPGSGVRADAFTLLRTRLGVGARLGGSARVFAELQDARAFGEEASTTEGSADALDLHQGWLELADRWGGSALSLRAGRQEIVVGNERLVGAVGWSNTGRSFDGARVDVGRPGTEDTWRGMAFAATLDERGRRHGALPEGVASSPDQVVAGVHATDGRVEGLVVHDRAARFRTFADVDRTTGYVRFHTPSLGSVRLDVEAAYQVGDQTPILPDGAAGAQQDVRAWLAGARLVRAGGGRVPTVTVGADWLSGDDDPADATYRAFNTLYASNHKWYGFMDLFLDPAAATRDRGLVDAVAGLAFPVSPRATVRADLHSFWTAAEGSGADGDRALGWELDVTVPVRVNAATGLELGYALFRPGPAGEAVGLGGEGRVRHWGYAQLRAAF